jgi:6-phosphogluconolactonase
MGTRFRFLAGLLLPVLLLCLSACNTSSSSSSASGTGALFVATQGDSSVSAFSIDLSAGTLTANGKAVAAGNTPAAMILAPSGKALFVANSNSAIPPNSPPCTLPSPGTIAAYTVGTDGTLTAVSGNSLAGSIPLAMAIDAGGHFLFVVNQGMQCDPASSTISVFAIQDSTLTQVAGSPFLAAGTSVASGAGPAGVAVTPDGKFLYVANQFDSTVTRYAVDANGVLTLGPSVPVGATPSAMTITADGGFLYVANASTVSAFAICNQVLISCNDPTDPDGSLSAVAGSPFSAGIGPAAIVAAPSGKFLFVVNRLSNQISQYKIATGTGVLTANTQATISTGANPVSATIRVSTTTVAATGGITDFLYVANLGASSISVYSFDSTVGTLGLVGGPVSVTGGQPSAVAAE